MDEISLTLPADEAFHRVAHLVVGGLAVRLDLTYEHLEDLELALHTLLERYGEDEVTVRMQVGEGELKTLVGPFGSDGVVDELSHDAGEALGLRRILEAVCDRVDVNDGWVELTKRMDAAR